VRQLDDDAIAGIARSAASYVERWQRFAAGLRRIA